ncbi:fimbrial protein [Aeromonas cavernicola]|uniref:Type 1 fimbrial protein n=1 Tax=Aeromonas cavernicola TaxID=1006623 RepID=A0A2H9U6J0_9GAMM|nr:fimbrial protein [Aeromonas cavernicola]PJG59650.1 type 1 fimbrial protein [Aeromonas cavernicola]
MKANKTLIAMGVASLMLSGAAMAQQGSGQVTFNGEIINAPCSVSADSENQVVELGQISIRQLTDGGQSAEKQFSIVLENCQITAADDAVKVTFGGTVDSVENDLLAIGGGQARGAGIKMFGVSGAPVVLGQATPATTLTNGTNTLVYAAALKGYDDSTANPLVAGAFTAVTNFTLAYE